MPTDRLIRAPRLRRPEEEGTDRRATWLELFFDLVFAAAVADVGTALSADYTPLGLFRFSFLFFLIWWAWTGHTFFSTRFDNDDFLHRFLTLGQVFFVAVMSVNAKTDIASREAAGFAAAYGGMRLLLAVQYGRVVSIAETRAFASRQLIGIATGAAIWLISSLLPPTGRFWFWGIALAIDLGTPVFARRAVGSLPPDPAHLPERFGLFTLILLGESVVAIMAGMRHQEIWTVPAASSAVLGMVLAFSLWWAYFDVLAAAAPKPARSPEEFRRLQLWTGAHLPLCFGIAVAAIGIEHIITLDGLTPLGVGALLLVGGIGVVMLALGVLAVTAPSAAPQRPHQVLTTYAGLALLLVPVAAVGGGMPPVWLLFWFVVLMVGLILLDQRRRAQAAALL